MRIKKAAADLLRLERVARVATTGPAGLPHVVPVCHVLVDGRVYFASGPKGRKVRNLEANPRAAVVVDVYSEAWRGLRGVMVQGRAALIRRGSRFRKIRRLLYEKYLQYPDDAAIDESDSVIVEVTPTHVFTWGMD